MNPRRLTGVVAELSLVALTVVTTISLERLFTETSFLREVLVMVLASHLVSIVARRAQLSMLWSTLMSCGTLVLLGTAVYYPESATVIVPSTETLTLLGDDLREAWQVFSDDAAPVPPLRGFLVTTSVLTWYGVFLADWAAFRLRSPLEAIAPATSVFVFAALLGVDRNQIAHGVLYAAGVLAVLLSLRAERQAREEVWVDGGTARGVETTLRTGAAVGVLAIVAGAVVAPQLPGADGEPLIDVTEINEGPETRRVVSPLVDIASQLIDQSDEEIFSVRVSQADRDYWRLMALTDFDGGTWKRSSNFDDAEGLVASDIDPSVTRRTVEQEFTTRLLDNIYLPAAYEVSRIVDNGGVALEYETATGALVVKKESERQARLGFTYTIESQVPDYNPEVLPARAAEGLSGGFVGEHTRLPDPCEPGQTSAADECWPAEVTALAQQITAGATTDYERVLRLQNHFTDPANYTYDINVARGEGVENIESFLFVVQRGYCQQFASTFAAMARSLGIPARVAVGFTPGTWSPEREEFVVRGHHAHAWPEVYFAGVGWVVFDPTPGRGRPHDADITGLEEEQFGDNTLNEPGAPTSTTLPGGGSSTSLGPLDPRDVDPSDTTAAAASEEDVAVGGDGGVPTPVVVVLAVLGVAAIVIGSVPAAKQLRRRRRLSRVAADPVGRGELAWDEAIDALRLVGHRPSHHHTPLEFAATVEEQSRRPLGPVRELAQEVTVLRYAEPGNGVEHAIAAQDASGAVVERCRQLAGRRAVVADAVDPRSLVSSRE